MPRLQCSLAKKDTGLTRFSLSGNFFPRMFTVFFLGLLLQFISTNKIHLAVLFLSNSRAVFLCVHFSFEFNWQCHCQLSHIELNQITLLPWKRIRTRMCETHSVYHLTMLTNLVLCRKSFGIVLHVRLTSSKQ